MTTLPKRIADAEGMVPHLALDPGKDSAGGPLNQINTGHGHCMDEFTPEAWAVLLPLVQAGVPVFAGRGLGTSPTMAVQMLKGHLRRIKKELRRVDVFRALAAKGNTKRIECLVEMAYQMGVTRLLRFRRMWAAIARDDWYGAAREVIHKNGDKPEDGPSGLAKQTPKRAKYYAETLRTGVVVDDG